MKRGCFEPGRNVDNFNFFRTIALFLSLKLGKKGAPEQGPLNLKKSRNQGSWGPSRDAFWWRIFGAWTLIYSEAGGAKRGRVVAAPDPPAAHRKIKARIILAGIGHLLWREWMRCACNMINLVSRRSQSKEARPSHCFQTST